MTEVVLTVQGAHTARYPAEQAVVRLSAGFEGATRAPVLASATELAAVLADSLRELAGDPALVGSRRPATPPPVLRWSAETVRVWSDRPWNQDGARLPLVYHATLGLTATFVDTEALAAWIEQQSAREGVTVDGVEWRLSDETERAALVRVRSEAVADAVAKARAYADSLGLDGLRPVAIADPGMLGDGSTPAGGGLEARQLHAAFKADGAPGLAFTPDDIEVAAAVDARFVATGA